MPVSGPRSRSRSSGDGEAPSRRLRRMSRPSAAAPPANAAVAPEASKKSDDAVLRTEPPAVGRRVERQPPVAVEPDSTHVRIRVGDSPAALVLVEVSAGEVRRDTGRDPEIPEHQRHRAREVLAVAAIVPRQEGDERRRAFVHRRRLVIGEVFRSKEPRLQRDRRGVRVPRAPDHLASLAVERLVLRLFVVLVEQLLQPRVSRPGFQTRDAEEAPDGQERAVGQDRFRIVRAVSAS